MLESLRLFYLEKGLAFYCILDFSFDGNQLKVFSFSSWTICQAHQIV